MTLFIFIVLYTVLVAAVALGLLASLLIYTGMTFREFTTFINNQRLGGN